VTVRLLETKIDVDPTAFVAPGATLLGEVRLGPRASVWYNAVLRGDIAPVAVGADSNVQDGVIMHVETDVAAVVGERVTIGHGAIVHAATVEDDCLIGIAAIVLSGARIGRGSIVAAGAVVREAFEVPPGSLVAGVPARILRPVTGPESARVDGNWRAYVEYAAGYRAGGRDRLRGGAP
jgi:carbonic anhydrase/acetyltransferase-like protein (isoleucine patch superfamily)